MIERSYRHRRQEIRRTRLGWSQSEEPWRWRVTATIGRIVSASRWAEECHGVALIVVGTSILVVD
jgi:hypothetical protein